MGERVLLLDEAEGGGDTHSAADADALRAALAASPADGPHHRRSGFRLAVLISRVEDLAHDWFSLGVIAGLDAAAADRGGRLELIGTREARPEVLARRLAEARPDALAYLAWQPEYLALLEVAHRLGLPTVFGGTSFARPNWAGVVYEDNAHSVELAVDALWSAGHREVALAINRWPEPWVFERQLGFEHSVETRGGDPDDLRVAWLGTEGTMAETTRRGPLPPDGLVAYERHEELLEGMADRLGRFLDHHRPTGLIVGSQIVADVLGRLVRRGAVRVPEELSVVCIDQHPQLTAWLGVEPTTVCLPLVEMGREIFAAAAEMTRPDRTPGAAVLPVARRVLCSLRAGRTVRSIGAG